MLIWVSSNHGIYEYIIRSVYKIHFNLWLELHSPSCPSCFITCLAIVCMPHHGWCHVKIKVLIMTVTWGRNDLYTCIHMKLSISNIQASLQICWSLFFPHNITILWVMIGPWPQNRSPTSSGSIRGVSVEKLRGVGSRYLGKGGFIGPWNSCMKKKDNTGYYWD